MRMDKEDAKDTLNFMEEILDIAQKISRTSALPVNFSSSAIEFEKTIDIINS
jgi:hypothetical protein